MSILKLRVDIEVDENSLSKENSVIANIYEVSDSPGKGHRSAGDRKKMRNLLIPLSSRWGANPRFYDVEIAPGKYVVEAILPSGQAIKEEVSIEHENETRQIRLRSKESPHEWLAWQHFVGNVQQDKDVYMQSTSKSPARSVFSFSEEVVSVLKQPPPVQGEAELSQQEALVSKGFFFEVDSLKNTDPGRPLSDFLPLNKPEPTVFVTGPLQPNVDDGISRVHFFDTKHKQIPRQIPGLKWDLRHYLFIRGEGIPAQYCVLPIPWIVPYSGKEAVVEVLVHHTRAAEGDSAGFDPGYRVSIAVRDPRLSSLIGYIGAGNLPTAAVIIDTAKDMLFEKMENPLAAAAGAYVLLSPEWSGPSQEWHRWVKNLMNWFELLPDGAIQYAWVKLNNWRCEEDISEARDCLLEGYRRGLPFFSKGVSLLLDGLTLIKNEAHNAGKQDNEVQQALATVHKLALRTNIRQPFTTVRIS